MKTIVANFGTQLNEEWILPMKAIKINGKIVSIIESPLVKATNYSALEKSQITVREAVMSKFLYPWERFKPQRNNSTAIDIQNIQKDKRAHLEMPPPSDDPFCTDVDFSALETFGGQLDGIDDEIIGNNCFFN